MHKILPLAALALALPAYVPLAGETKLTFHAGQSTSWHRVAPVAQLHCAEGCQLAPQLSSVTCTQLPNFGGDPAWDCRGSLPSGCRFSRATVSCEARDPDSDDGLVLAGSCGLTYGLEPSAVASAPAWTADWDLLFEASLVMALAAFLSWMLVSVLCLPSEKPARSSSPVREVEPLPSAPSPSPERERSPKRKQREYVPPTPVYVPPPVFIQPTPPQVVYQSPYPAWSSPPSVRILHTSARSVAPPPIARPSTAHGGTKRRLSESKFGSFASEQAAPPKAEKPAEPEPATQAVVASTVLRKPDEPEPVARVVANTVKR